MKIEFGTEDTKKHIISQYPYTAGVLSDGGSLIVAKDEKEQIIGFYGVLEGYQCKGIGSALAQKCIARASYVRITWA